MKRTQYILLTFLSATVIGTGCNKKLEEDPKSILTPAFFSTTQGFQTGLDAAYAGNRYLWGNQDLFTVTVIGTDEFKRGIDGNSDINLYASNYTSQTGVVGAIWRNCYTFINTCNGLIDNGPNVDLPAATRNRMIGEAKFLRAQYYFVLVQFYADVTLNTHLQTDPTTSAKRDPLADVYKLIIQDLKDAIPVLPASPKSSGVLPGKLSAAAAKHLLAKVYLTKGGSPAKETTDNDNAYTTAMDLINTRASLGLELLPDFGDVFAEGNESNNEVLWTVQHTSNLAFNGPNNSGGTDNVLNHMWVPQYEKQPGMIRSTLYGRPYIRCTPTLWLVNTAFADKTNDTRYKKTFQTVWFANDPAIPGTYPKWPSPLPAGAPPGAVAGQPKFKFGDTAIYMPGVNVTAAQIAAAPYLLMGPSNYNNTLGPTMKKFFDTKRADLNFPSIRPVIVYRLSETYLIAAEAAFKTSRMPEAVTLINTVRQRAAFNGGNGAAMNIVAADLSLDFILDERTRELCGENVRWWDLVRTGKLIDRVKLYNPEAGPNILPKHVLRPIPQSQIDATVTGEPYNNSIYFPGWN